MAPTLVVLLVAFLLILLAPASPVSLSSPSFLLNRIRNRTYEMSVVREKDSRSSSSVINNTSVIASPDIQASVSPAGSWTPLCPRCAAERALAQALWPSMPATPGVSTTGVSTTGASTTGVSTAGTGTTAASPTGTSTAGTRTTGASTTGVSTAGASPPPPGARNISSNESDTGAGPSTTTNTAAQPHAASITEEDLRQLRLEMVKTHFLSKLQLTERPQVELHREELPRVISSRVLPLMLASQPSTTAPTPPPANRTSIILSTKRVSCRGQETAVCFLFTLEEPPSRGAAAATLWLWKLEDPADGFQQTLSVAVASRGHHRPLIALKSTSTRAGWVEMDVSREVSVWLARGRYQVQVQVSCPTCQANRHPISYHPDHRPFIVLTTQQPQVRKRRSSRECSSLWGGGCCREALNVSVSEMGWDDWLVHPQSFTFYYCHGTCRPSIASATAPGVSRYSNLLQALMLRQPLQSSLREALTPCCAPTSYSDMPLIQRGFNNTVIVNRIPDLLVDSCGCND